MHCWMIQRVKNRFLVILGLRSVGSSSYCILYIDNDCCLLASSNVSRSSGFIQKSQNCIFEWFKGSENRFLDHFKDFGSFCQSVSLSISLSACQSLSLSVCLSVSLAVYHSSLCLSVTLSVCLSVSLSVCLSLCLSVSLSVFQSVCLLLRQFLSQSVSQSVSQFVSPSVS